MSPTALNFRWKAAEVDVLHTWRRASAGLLWRSAAQGLAWIAVVAALVAWTLGPPVWSGVAISGSVFSVSWLLALWFAPGRQVSIARSAGLLPLGPTEATLDRSGLFVRNEASVARLAWGAVRRIRTDRRGLWLELGAGLHLLVPVRALGTADTSILETWRADPLPVEPLPPGPDTSAWDLSCALTLDDWVHALAVGEKRRLRARLRRSWPLVGLSALATWLYLQLAGVPALDALRPVAAVFAVVSLALWLRTLALQRLRPHWWRRRMAKWPANLPLGPSTWRVGPGGIWSATSRGATQYSWSYVPAVERDAEQVRMAVGVMLVMVIPLRAFPTEASADAFVGDVQAWIAGSPPLSNGRPPPGRGRATSLQNPFASLDPGR